MRYLWLVALLLVGCPKAIPTPMPPTTTTTSVPTLSPRVDRHINLQDVRGVTAFGATLLTKDELLAFIIHAKAANINTFRVGAQTDGWCGMQPEPTYLVCGPSLGTSEWHSNLKRLLDVTSRIPDVWIQLIPTFTHKQDSGGLPRFMAMTENVIAVQQAGSLDDPTPYKHVIWEAANEFIHPISSIRMRHMKKLLERLKGTGLPVGADYGGGRTQPWPGEYLEELLPYVDYIAFHPPRNRLEDGVCTSIRPGINRIRRIVRKYNKPVWFDETLSYTSEESKELYGYTVSGHDALCALGTDEERRREIQAFKNDAINAGAIWFTHARWLFGCKRLGWLPN